MKKNKRKYLYNGKTYLWGILSWFWGLTCFYALIDEGVSLSWLLVLAFMIWRYIANRIKSRTPEVQNELVRKQEEQQKYEAKQYEVKCLEEINRNQTYRKPYYSQPKRVHNTSSVGKAAATTGLIVGYTGLRVISSLAKPYMGSKGRKRRRRRW